MKLLRCTSRRCAVVGVMLTAALLMTGYETLKHSYLLDLSAWESSVLTIGFAVLVAGGVAGAVFRRFTVLQQAALEREVNKRTEAALREERNLHIGGPTVVFKWKAAEGWPVEYVSPNVEAQFGYTPAEFTEGKTSYASLIHPADLTRVTAEVATHSQSGVASFEQRYRIRHSDGTYRWIYDFTIISRIKPGDISHYHGYILDITAQIEAETRIRQNEERHRTVIEASQDAILVQTIDGRILECNTAACKLYQYAPEEMRKLSVIDLVPDKARNPMESLASESMLRGGVMSSHGVRKGGELFPTEVSTRLIMVQNVPLVVAYVRDIGERLRAEERQRQSLTEKEVLLREVHHRVKNNLQIISSLLHLQTVNVDDRRVLDLFMECQRRVRSMSLIHERLYQSQNMAEVDFDHYARQLLEELLQTFGCQPGEIRLDLDIQAPRLDVNLAIPCGLIINELASNAMKFGFRATDGGTAAGGEAKTIRVTLRPESDDLLLLEVGNNGQEFPPDIDIPHVKTLGLQLVHTLTQQLKGTLAVIHDQGVAFQIRFPRITPLPAPAATAPKPAAPSDASGRT